MDGKGPAASSRKAVLSIAGSDCSGGAGVQADLKTMLAHGVYGMCAITALTAQNTMGVAAVKETDPRLLAQQIDAVFSDIRPDAVKVGMLSTASAVELVSERLAAYAACNVVVDPVMVATSGSVLMQQSAIATLKACLLPRACVATPNIPEAEVLAGMAIRTKADMERAALALHAECGCAVLLKGGHAVGAAAADDVLCTQEGLLWLQGEYVETANTHGTGCTLSSAIACNLAQGAQLEQACRAAKDYVAGALAAGLDLGHGNGPIDHGFCLGV